MSWNCVRQLFFLNSTNLDKAFCMYKILRNRYKLYELGGHKDICWAHGRFVFFFQLVFFSWASAICVNNGWKTSIFNLIFKVCVAVQPIIGQVLCAITQYLTHYLKKRVSCSKLSEKITKITRLRGSWKFEQNNANFEFLGHFTSKYLLHFFLKPSVDNFEIAHETYSIPVRVRFLLYPN